MIDYKKYAFNCIQYKDFRKRMRFNKEYYHSDKKHVLNNFSHNNYNIMNGNQ